MGILCYRILSFNYKHETNFNKSTAITIFSSWNFKIRPRRFNISWPSWWKTNSNIRLRFEQGTVHDDYLLHLYDLFKSCCPQAPKVYTRLPDKRTGEIFYRISFYTYSLPCFTDIFDLFYLDGKKIIPSNIGDLLTPLGLCYWICDDGSFNHRDKAVVLHTQSFTHEEVKLLVGVLTNKFNLKCTINRKGDCYIIIISAKSLPGLQKLLKPHMPCMMNYKIGL
jgi:hypothetical protein